MKAPPCFDDTETKRMVRKICESHNIDADLLKDLCELIVEHSGSGRRFGIAAEVEVIIDRFNIRNVKES